MTNNFYRAFEDRYRGSRDVIKSRLAAYLPFVTPLISPGLTSGALDLGCGRGEWLELLAENNFDARGVDLDANMLEACRERALQVEQADALTSLRALPAQSLALVSAFHLVEHIPFDQVQELISEALRVLRPGGLLIMETPNSENLVVGASSFYMDPSHLRPVPSALLGFVTEHLGFARHKVVRLQESKQLHTSAPIGLINVLDGVSPDYGIVAQKTASQDMLAAFDAPFEASYGIALGDLAERYEHQEDQRRKELHGGLARTADGLRQLEVHTIESKVRIQRLENTMARTAGGLNQLEGDSVESKVRIQRLENTVAHLMRCIEERTAQAEMQAAQLTQHIADLQSSRSWRITAPLRAAGDLIRRVDAPGHIRLFKSVFRQRIKGAAVRLAHWILRRPRLKKTVRSLLRYLPGLRVRLRDLAFAGPAPDELPPLGADISPRTARMVRELKQSLEAKKN